MLKPLATTLLLSLCCASAQACSASGRVRFPVSIACALEALPCVSRSICVIACPTCGEQQLASTHDFTCPGCGVPCGEVVGGKELEIVDITLDEAVVPA